MTDSEAMSAEFDTVAEWTAEVAAALGPPTYLPAACRGSGGAPAYDWMLDHLGVVRGTRLLDSGAGVGGPAAYAAERRGARPTLVEPEAGACRGARRLFGLPVVRGDAAALPVADAGFEVAWSLGVLCTMTEQRAVLDELHRAVGAAGRIGLLAYVAHTPEPPGQPEGNNFPTMARLLDLLAAARLRVTAISCLPLLADEPDGWREAEDAVDAELKRRYGARPAWRTAEEQTRRIGRLISERAVTGALFALECVA